ncbi:hypothetical protein SAMN02745146_1869 [Hymenobacter daecheongensis DSM 21074]|uniref:Uncharacterized protein n=1 Tax=Hymenobacter daecheongensis DSM 21074 TaxID=1121955 RepID=A0A1M6EYT8_9BACT|nr:hypothetical protein [Hymenobacter daecheongensis]SHI90585.1 hypothetical protein SAMN02745146_1869 [Hymenobacter daecheongensis DSM 21074]
MPSSKVKRPPFTLEAVVKRFVYSQSVTIDACEAYAKGESFTLPQIPEDEGSLKNPLAFPQLIEVDSEGRQVPASPARWDVFLLQRLRTSGIEPVSADAVLIPSEAYNVELLTFHLGQLGSTRARADFQGYLRRLLLEGIGVAQQTDEKEATQVLRNTLAWLESYSKQLAAGHLAEAKGEGPGKHTTVKQKVLAYKLLIAHGEVKLSNNNDIDQQVDFIHSQIGSYKTTIRRYLNSNLSAVARERARDFIYTEDNFEQAIRFIHGIRPCLDTGAYQLKDVSKK